MKIGEVIDFLGQFNHEADFKVVMPNGTPIDINKNDFGWSSGGEGGTKVDVIEVCVMLNSPENEK
jgi:hypothetical protein